MEVQSIALNSANVRYNNANDEKRVYDIESNVNIQGQNVNGFESGVIKKDNIQVATFSMWGEDLNPSFKGLSGTERCAVLMAINDFIESVEVKVSTTDFNV